MKPWALAVLALLTVGVAAAGDDTPPSPSVPAATDVANAELLHRIERLEAEIRELRAAAGATIPAALAARVEKLEQEVAALRHALEESHQGVDEIWTTLDDEAEAERRRSHVTVYGTMSFEDFHDADSTLDAEAFELVLSGRPHERLGYFAEVEFERAASVGGERGGEVLVEQAYANYRLFPAMDFRAGVLLVPFGNLGVDHYAPNREVISKPLVSNLLAPSDWTDNGAGFEGSFSIGGSWLATYEAYVVAGLDDHVSAAGTRDARQSFGHDNNGDKAIATRWSVERGSDFQLGASAYRGKYDDDSRYLLTGAAVDLRWSRGPLRLTGEIDRFWVERRSGRDGRFDGWYGRAAYTLPSSWLAHGAHGRSFPNARLTLVAQYEEITLDDPWTRPEGENRESRATVGISYRPTHQWVLKVNHERSRGHGDILVHGDSEGWLASVGFVF